MWAYPASFAGLKTVGNPLFSPDAELTAQEIEKGTVTIANAALLFDKGAYALKAHKEEFYPHQTEDLRTLEFGRMRVKYRGELERYVTHGQAVMLGRFKDRFRTDLEIPQGIFGYGIVDYVQPVSSRLNDYEIQFSLVEQFPAIVSNSMTRMHVGHQLRYAFNSSLQPDQPKKQPQLYTHIHHWQSNASCQPLDVPHVNFILNTNTAHITDGNWARVFDKFVRDSNAQRKSA